MKKYFYSMIVFLFVVAPQSAIGLSVPTIGGISTQESFDAILVKVINTVLTVVGSLAILMIIVSGIMYITSAGDSAKVDTAKSWLTYSIVGLVVVLLAYVIVVVVSGALTG